MRILGIDPGLNTTGYGVIEVAAARPTLVEAGVVRGRDRGPIAHRVSEIHAGVLDVLHSHKPDVMALEELYSHYERPRTAILMGHARGVICLAATQAEIEVAHFAATRVKKTLTGNGRAPKRQIQEAIRRELGLSRLPEPPDVADALAVALCYLFAVLPQKLENYVPSSHRPSVPQSP
jgi:crossover junction endodeoxyribonuclease RuvC